MHELSIAINLGLKESYHEKLYNSFIKCVHLCESIINASRIDLDELYDLKYKIKGYLF